MFRVPVNPLLQNKFLDRLEGKTGEGPFFKVRQCNFSERFYVVYKKRAKNGLKRVIYGVYDDFLCNRPYLCKDSNMSENLAGQVVMW